MTGKTDAPAPKPDPVAVIARHMADLLEQYGDGPVGAWSPDDPVVRRAAEQAAVEIAGGPSTFKDTTR